MTHELKILPEYYSKVITGEKTFELRKDDRGFQEGDYIILREINNGKYTGRRTDPIRISYILRNCKDYGLQDGFCILGFVRYISGVNNAAHQQTLKSSQKHIELEHAFRSGMSAGYGMV